MLTRVLMLSLALLGFVLFPALALAQDVATTVGEMLPDEPIGFWGTVLAILATLVPAILAGLRWGAGLLAKVIEKHIEHEWGKGALLRLLSEVNALADLVGTSTQELVMNARKPSSPGGVEITKSELSNISEAIVEQLALRYGGWEQFFEMLKRIGLGSTDAEAKAALLSQVNVAVARKVAANPPLPRAA
jgi:hypothetical protein